MSEQKYKAQAEALTKQTPDHLGFSAFPPQGWSVEGEEIIVLCADGRKVRGPLLALADKVMTLPTHPTKTATKSGKKIGN
jgi:hypothetical protein